MFDRILGCAYVPSARFSLVLCLVLVMTRFISGLVWFSLAWHPRLRRRWLFWCGQSCYFCQFACPVGAVLRRRTLGLATLLLLSSTFTTISIKEDIRLMSHWNMYHALWDGNTNYILPMMSTKNTMDTIINSTITAASLRGKTGLPLTIPLCPK